MKHVEERFGPGASKEVLLMCIGITSGVGRLIFGRVADYVHGVNKVYLQVSACLNSHKNTGKVNAFVPFLAARSAGVSARKVAFINKI